MLMLSYLKVRERYIADPNEVEHGSSSKYSWPGKDICDDPFIFASQAKKVFYVENKRQKDWLVVVHAKVRDVYDLGDGQSNDIDKGNEQVLEEINDNDLIRPEADDSGDIIEVEINMEDIPPNDEEVETEDESEEDLFS
ncbi:hypothetical protein QL285_084963 [Trifolium repens]|nr:hypothetical protein QL285_084963 [Trifolium repens]